MKSAYKYLRQKQAKPIPKRGSPEYLEFQKRLIERKSKITSTHPESEPPKEIPSTLKYLMRMLALPPTVGVIAMMSSEYSSSLYQTSLALTGTWIGTTTVLFSGSLLGLEALYYTIPYYAASKNFMFVGGRRVFFGMSGLSMGFLCLYSTFNQSWVGYFGYFVWLLINTLYTIRNSEQNLIPKFIGQSTWPWLLYSQLLVVFITYSLFSKNARDEIEDFNSS